MNTKFHAAALFCAAALSVTSVYAQGVQSGTIRGTVSAADGSVLTGVTITIESPSLQGQRRTTTEGHGIYTFPALPPATTLSMPPCTAWRPFAAGLRFRSAATSS
jgi:hypothetical protein